MSDVEKTTSDIVFFISDIIFQVICKRMATLSSATLASSTVLWKPYPEIILVVNDWKSSIS